MNKKYVIAGSHYQYLTWLRDSGLTSNQAIYLSSDDQLRGLELSPSDVIYVGEHWKSPIDLALLKSRIRKS